MANEKVMPVGAGKNMGMPYQPFGDLYLSMPGHAAYTNYERWLDIDNGKTVVRYMVDGVRYEREVITPLGGHPVMVVRLTASITWLHQGKSSNKIPLINGTSAIKSLRYKFFQT